MNEVITNMRLRGLLTVVNGKYLDRQTGQGYVRQELYSVAPWDVLQREIHMEKVDRGVYVVTVEGPEPIVYELYSRRRGSRGRSN